MDTENTNDEQNESLSKETFPTKSLGEERIGSQTTPTNTDINDPENLDYEDIDDNHPIKNPVKKNHQLISMKKVKLQIIHQLQVMKEN